MVANHGQKVATVATYGNRKHDRGSGRGLVLMKLGEKYRADYGGFRLFVECREDHIAVRVWHFMSDRYVEEESMPIASGLDKGKLKAREMLAPLVNRSADLLRADLKWQQ